MFRALGYKDEEIDELINAGAFNAFFVLGRTIGFIGHYLDEKRLDMPLYRHPTDDILYDVKRPEGLSPVIKIYNKRDCYSYNKQNSNKNKKRDKK